MITPQLIGIALVFAIAGALLASRRSKKKQLTDPAQKQKLRDLSEKLAQDGLPHLAALVNAMANDNPEEVRTQIDQICGIMSNEETRKQAMLKVIRLAIPRLSKDPDLDAAIEKIVGENFQMVDEQGSARLKDASRTLGQVGLPILSDLAAAVGSGNMNDLRNAISELTATFRDDDSRANAVMRVIRASLRKLLDNPSYRAEIERIVAEWKSFANRELTIAPVESKPQDNRMQLDHQANVVAQSPGMPPGVAQQRQTASGQFQGRTVTDVEGQVAPGSVDVSMQHQQPRTQTATAQTTLTPEQQQAGYVPPRDYR